MGSGGHPCRKIPGAQNGLPLVVGALLHQRVYSWTGPLGKGPQWKSGRQWLQVEAPHVEADLSGTRRFKRWAPQPNELGPDWRRVAQDRQVRRSETKALVRAATVRWSLRVARRRLPKWRGSCCPLVALSPLPVPLPLSPVLSLWVLPAL